MSGNSLYDPDQSALDTRWIQPWSGAFRVSEVHQHLARCAQLLSRGFSACLCATSELTWQRRKCITNNSLILRNFQYLFSFQCVLHHDSYPGLYSNERQAQRDVGLRIPINFHTVPAVSLTQACFSKKQYEHTAFQKCLSNLLGIGVRRFAIDAYWDARQSVWSLCPVEQPGSHNPDVGTSVSTSTGSTVILSTDTASARVPETTAAPLNSLGFERRQDATTISSPAALSASAASSSLSSTSPSTSASAVPSLISFPTTDGSTLLQIGNYNCTLQMRLDLFTGILEDFLDSTSTTIGAAIIVLTLDVHAASSLLNPNAPSPELSQPQLPESGSLLSDIMKGNLSSRTYTPSLLQEQRANLNKSWDNIDRDTRPAPGYYGRATNPQRNKYTADGWPTEGFIEFQQFYRLVTGYGSVDSQMRLYNIGPDLDFMFPPGALTTSRTTSVTSDGQLSSGCLFDGAVNTVTANSNSSWAVSTTPPVDLGANPDLMVSISAISNLTACGLTPLLNVSLTKATADENPLPYAAYVHSTLWSWAPGEPSPDTEMTNKRCATMTISPYAGRWRVADCKERHRVACHDPMLPYDWELSTRVTDYDGAASACPEGKEFIVPHTALENAHLLAALRGSHDNSDQPILVDLNSISVPDCWVIGRNGTCPYLSTMDRNRTRIVVVPTVAAVIIFVLAALTFFVKCASNRRENKRGRRRRMVGGWEYEGVPS
jgi:hypothetical protein